MKNNITSLQHHMEMLCHSIGARPTGSKKNKGAVQYAIEVFQKCGFKTHRQEFYCMDWRNSGALLYIDKQNIPAEPAEYSLPCDIEAEFVCLDTVDALQKSELSGKIAVLHGDLCKEPLMPKNFEFYNPNEHKQIIALLEEKKPLAIITVISQNEHIIQDGDFNIPCAVVCKDMLDTFLQHKEQKIQLTINTERIPSIAHNVIALYGTGCHKVCFSAHIDTKPTTPGALDNASGVSVLLALAESLSGNEYPFVVEIVLFNGEDYYSIPGEILYMSGLTPEYKLAVNIDGIGLKDSLTSISFYECSKDFENRIMKLVEARNDMEQIPPWPMGDHMIFATRGIHTIAMTASNSFNMLGSIIHSPDDNLSNINYDVLEKAVGFLMDILNEMR